MTVLNLEHIAAALDDRKARAAEYAKYRARNDIYVDGVLAVLAGDQVPTGHVEGYTRQVGVFDYDPKTGQHVPKMKDGVQVAEPQKVRPVYDRADVYEVGGADDPNMPKASAPEKPKG